MSNEQRRSKSKAFDVNRNNKASNQIDQYIYKNDVLVTDDQEISAGFNPNNSTDQLVRLDFEPEGETYDSQPLDFGLIDQEDFDDDCKDGSHRDFAENLNDQLLQLAEGYADPTPSVLLGDFEQESEEEYSGQCPIELGVPQANSTEGKSTSHTTNFSASTVNTNPGRPGNPAAEARSKMSSVTSSKARANNKKKNRRKNNQQTSDNRSHITDTSATSKNRLPAWMQQAEEVVESDSYQEQERMSQGNRSATKSRNGIGYLEARSNHGAQNQQTSNYDRASQATGRSTNKSLPSWMQNAADNNEIDEQDLDDEEDNLDLNGEEADGYLNDTTVAKDPVHAQAVASIASTNSRNSYGERNSGSNYRTAPQLSQKSQDSANWTQNRAYFLRMNKMNEKDSSRSWTKMAKSSSSVGKNNGNVIYGTERDATIRAITDELEETKMSNKNKEVVISDLHEQINQLQESQIQEEVDRVEAEISRERAVNDNRKLVIEKTDLENKLKKFEEQLKQQQAEMERKVQEELNKRLEQEKRVSQLQEELKSTKDTAANIQSQMTTLDAVMMEKDYAKKMLQTEQIIRNQGEEESKSKAVLETSACQTEDELMVTMVSSSTVVKMPEANVTKAPSISNSEDQEQHLESSLDESHSSEYTDAADDEQTVVSNLHSSRKSTKEKREKSSKQVKFSSSSQAGQASSSSLRRVQTMPVFATETGFLNRVFTKVAQNSSFLNATAKSVFGVMLLANIANENIGVGKMLFDFVFSKRDSRITQNAKFFDSGMGQGSRDEEERQSYRRVASMDSLHQKSSSKSKSRKR